MSDYESDGYEIEQDIEYEYEQHVFDQEASRKYRQQLLKRSALNNKKDSKDMTKDLVFVNMFSDEDTDSGLLEGVGGYFQVVKTSIRSLNIRRSTINALVFRFLIKLYKIPMKLPSKTTVEEFEQFRLSTPARDLIKRDDSWKDFKMFLTMKFMTQSDKYVYSVYSKSLIDEFNTNYIEFLISKSRHIYNSVNADIELTEFKALHDSVERDPLTLNKTSSFQEREYYNNGFYDQLTKAKVLRCKEHAEAFSNFTILSELPLNTTNWNENHEKTYENFLSRTNTISYIDVDYKYNISYISKRNPLMMVASEWKMFNDNVLKVLKELVTGIAIDFCEQGKIFLKTSALKRNLSLNKDTLIRFMDASSCNYCQLVNDDTNSMIIQTSLNNVLILSTPIQIFTKSFMLCKDISFCKVEDTRLNVNNKLINTVKKFQSRMFSQGIDYVSYESFILSYYARLSSIDVEHLESWMSKMRKLKGKILQSSSYCRHVSALVIQNLYRHKREKGFYGLKRLERVLKKKLLEQEQKYSIYRDEAFQNYLKNSSSIIITRFFRNLLDKKITKPFVEAYQKEKQLYHDALKSKIKTSLIELKSRRISKVQKLDHERKVDYRLTMKNTITISSSYNTSEKWFGFTRNDSLSNLVISTGHDVCLLEEKHTYTRSEFLSLLECIADICSCTKSYQFVKLCRSLSGKQHKENTIKDFINGFCWMFSNLTKGSLLHMVNLFCKSTNNHKFMIYVVNNINTMDVV